MLASTNSCVVKNGSIPVYLNVYDLPWVPGCTYWLGLGAHHSGVEVHGVECAYGQSDDSTTGIFFIKEPRKVEGFKYRKTVLIGWTEFSKSQVKTIMKEFGKEYKGNAYHRITKNCNHFSNDFCIRLTGNPIPKWVNRLARIGFLCIGKCMVSIDNRKREREKKKKKEDNNIERNRSKRISETSTSSSSKTPSPSDDATTGTDGSVFCRRFCSSVSSTTPLIK